MHPADIHASLKKAGATQTSIARSLSVTHGAVQLVMRGATKSARIARRISEVTGIPVSTLWPGKYPDIEKQARAGVDSKTLPSAALLKQLKARPGR